MRANLTAFISVLLASTAATAFEPETVAFHAPDGHRLAADYFPPPTTTRQDAPIVMLLHDAGGRRQDWQPLVEALHEAGCATLTLDLRGHGESATTATRPRAADLDARLFRSMQHDLRGAYDWLAEQPGVDRARFAVIGAGVGCSVALQYAATDRSVDTVVGLSPVLRKAGLDAAGDMHQITGRKILLITTRKERDAAYTLQERGDKGIEVKLVDGHDQHGTKLLTAVRKLDCTIADFVKKGVGEPSQRVVYGSINSRIFHAAGSGWIERIAPTNMRHYSSPEEAKARGLRAARSRGPVRQTGDEQRRGRRRRRP